MSCQGDACGAVTIFWDGPTHSYRVYNDSSRSVLMTFTAGPSFIEVLLLPRQIHVIAISEFDLPYQAQFVAP
jgi:hypothetical protein